MNLSGIISNQINAERNIVRSLWDKLQEPSRRGKLVFSKLIGRAAPYTGSIGAFRSGAEAGFAARFFTTNHLYVIA